jgi:hypothetical protein
MAADIRKARNNSTENRSGDLFSAKIEAGDIDVDDEQVNVIVSVMATTAITVIFRRR